MMEYIEQLPSKNRSTRSAAAVMLVPVFANILADAYRRETRLRPALEGRGFSSAFGSESDQTACNNANEADN